MCPMKKQVTNPYLPSWEYVPDGEPHVFGDRLYIYGSHDKFGGTQFCENDYVCWSAPIDDLSHWRFEGTIYRKSQDPKNKLISSTMYAPDCCQGPDGRYYLYYGLNFIPLTGVAVCDTPAGNFEFLGYVRHRNGKLYGRGKADRFPFDPAVLNDDGKIYLYSGFSPAQPFLRLINWTSPVKGAIGNQVLELEKDMLTIKSVKPLIPGADNSKGTGFEGHEFYEASSIRKFGDKYYFVYSSVLSHELCYAVSSHPDRGFVFGGTLHSNCDIGYKGNKKSLNYWGNNHGGITKIRDKYYVFGHRQTNQRECNRQAVAEVLKMNDDGSFEQAEMTSQGLSGAPLGKGRYEAGIACNLYAKEGAVKSTFFRNKKLCEIHPFITQDGADREGEPCQYIKNMRRGAVAGYKYFKCQSESVTVSVRGSAGKLEVLFSPEEKPAAEIALTGSEDFVSYTAPLSFEGEKAIYLRYEGDGSIDILWLELD